MAFTAAKLTELPLRTPLPFVSYSHISSLNLFFSLPKHSFHFSLWSVIDPNSISNRHSHPWCHRLSSVPLNTGGANFSLQVLPSSSEKVIQSDGDNEADVETRYFDKDKGRSDIDRIVLRLRYLGLGTDNEEEEDDETEDYNSTPVTGEERLGDLLQREWVRPTRLIEREKEEDLLPWERKEAESAAFVAIATENNLTGGVLLLRNKYFIVIYRGKDFLPPSVAAALAERQDKKDSRR